MVAEFIAAEMRRDKIRPRRMFLYFNAMVKLPSGQCAIENSYSMRTEKLGDSRLTAKKIEWCTMWRIADKLTDGQLLCVVKVDCGRR